MIDLRSDTVTKPTENMRKAMAAAEVGDDVFMEDPTVQRLEELIAEILGFEAGLFTVSGTMGNLLCLLSHCGRGDEILIGDKSHIFIYEQGGAAGLGGIHPRTVCTKEDGSLPLDLLESSIRRDNIHFPVTRLISVENTHNLCGGAPLNVEYMNKLTALAAKYNLKVHVDGARIFNAAAAFGVKVSDLLVNVDSVSCCLSKGLAAPVGTVICGTKDFIFKARRNRKMIGGGMRQVGVIAAAGIVAITEMVDRLPEDHENAKKVAIELSKVDGLKTTPELVKTNIVFVEVTKKGLCPDEVSAKLKDEGVLAFSYDNKRIRLVFHYEVTKNDVCKVIEAFKKVVSR